MNYVSDIGMYVINRSREASCLHRTVFCNKTCYMNKLECAFNRTISPKDVENDASWEAETYLSELEAMRNNPDRLRLMSRGEALARPEDIAKVARLCQMMPQTLIWLPTRCWRNRTMRIGAEALKQVHSNLVLQASIDPSNTLGEMADLKDSGWQLIFYGDDHIWEDTNMFVKCPKTWNKIKGHCAVCKTGCFAGRDVWLKKH